MDVKINERRVFSLEKVEIVVKQRAGRDGRNPGFAPAAGGAAPRYSLWANRYVPLANSRFFWSLSPVT